MSLTIIPFVLPSLLTRSVVLNLFHPMTHFAVSRRPRDPLWEKYREITTGLVIQFTMHCDGGYTLWLHSNTRASEASPNFFLTFIKRVKIHMGEGKSGRKWRQCIVSVSNCIKVSKKLSELWENSRFILEKQGEWSEPDFFWMLYLYQKGEIF